MYHFSKLAVTSAMRRWTTELAFSLSKSLLYAA